jgi:hypothetical protein
MNKIKNILEKIATFEPEITSSSDEKAGVENIDRAVEELKIKFSVVELKTALRYCKIRYFMARMSHFFLTPFAAALLGIVSIESLYQYIGTEWANVTGVSIALIVLLVLGNIGRSHRERFIVPLTILKCYFLKAAKYKRQDSASAKEF